MLYDLPVDILRCHETGPNSGTKAVVWVPIPVSGPENRVIRAVGKPPTPIPILDYGAEILGTGLLIM